MNNVRSITALNDYELQRIARDPAASSSKGSWHDEYRDSAVVFVGGLDSALTEGDVITIFSQYGEVLDINLPKWAQPRPEGQNGQSERERTEAQARVGKRRGFGFLLYEDQRSTILAVDNLNGAQVLGRTLRVDHVKDYRQLEKDESTGKMREAEERRLNAQPVLEGAPSKGTDGGRDCDGSSAGSASPAPSIDLEDPMASYFAHQKKSGKKRTKAVEDAEKAAKKARKEERAKIREQREQRKREGDRAKTGRREVEDDGRSSSRRSEHREGSRRSRSPGRRDLDEREDRYRSYEREERSRDRRNDDSRGGRRYDDRYRDDDYDRARKDDRRR